MYEQIKDEKLSIPENITNLVLEAKLKNLPFAVLKGGVKNIFSKEDFDKYNEHIKNDFYSQTYKSRAVIEEEDLKFFTISLTVTVFILSPKYFFDFRYIYLIYISGT